jgi:prophage regulatory protein
MESIRGEVTGKKQGAADEPGQLQRIIRKKDLPDYVGLKRTAIDDAIKRGDFPKPIQLGPRAVGWTEEDLLRWQAKKIAQRDLANNRNT